MKIFCDEKEGLQNMELLYSLASKQPPTTEPSEIQSEDWKGDKIKRKLEPHKLVGRRKFRYI